MTIDGSAQNYSVSLLGKGIKDVDPKWWPCKDVTASVAVHLRNKKYVFYYNTMYQPSAIGIRDSICLLFTFRQSLGHAGELVLLASNALCILWFSMNAGVAMSWVVLLALTSVSCVTDPQNDDEIDSIGIVHFNNPRLLPSDVEVPDRYTFDATQENTDPSRMGGIHLKEEARKLGLKFQKLANEEAGVTAMQVGAVSSCLKCSVFHLYLVPWTCKSGSHLH
jgi:hypothetical protein